MAQANRIPRDARILPKKEVLKIVPWSNTTLYRKIRAQEFPKPVKFSAKRVGWWSHEIYAHLQQIAQAAV